MTDLDEYVNPRTGRKAPLLADEVFRVIEKKKGKTDSIIIQPAFPIRLLPIHGIHLDNFKAAIAAYSSMREYQS